MPVKYGDTIYIYIIIYIYIKKQLLAETKLLTIKSTLEDKTIHYITSTLQYTPSKGHAHGLSKHYVHCTAHEE